MRLAQSKLTSQGQISVPGEVRRRLGLAPGGMLAWETLDNGDIVVRRAEKLSFAQIRTRFAHLRPARPVTVDQMSTAVARHLAQKHSRRMSKVRG